MFRLLLALVYKNRSLFIDPVQTFKLLTDRFICKNVYQIDKCTHITNMPVDQQTAKKKKKT